jgi:hypothetical protein
MTHEQGHTWQSNFLGANFLPSYFTSIFFGGLTTQDLSPGNKAYQSSPFESGSFCPRGDSGRKRSCIAAAMNRLRNLLKLFSRRGLVISFIAVSVLPAKARDELDFTRCNQVLSKQLQFVGLVLFDGQDVSLSTTSRSTLTAQHGHVPAGGVTRRSKPRASAPL